MSKYQQVSFSNRTNTLDNIFILDRSHQKLVTGKHDYRYLVEANVGYWILMSFLLFILIIVTMPSGDKIPNTFVLEPIHIIGLSITTIIVWIILQLHSYLQFQRKWLNGHIIYGQIKRINGEKVRWSGGKRGNTPITSYEVTVHCQFINPQGRAISTHATHLRKDLINKGTPKQAVVAILYVNDQHYIVL